MKYLKLYENSEDIDYVDKPASFYRKIYNDMERNLQDNIIDIIEKKMDEFGLDFYYIKNEYNPAKIGEFPVYDIQKGRNGIIIEYFDKQGESYIDLDEAPLDTIIDILDDIEDADLENLIDYAINNEKEGMMEDLIKNNIDDIDLSNFYDDNDIVDLYDKYKYSIRGTFDLYDVQKHLIKNHINWFIDKVINKKIDINDDISEEFGDEIDPLLNMNDIGLM